MGKTTGFMDYSRELAPRRPVLERVNDWFEIYQDFPEDKLRKQGARCMDCGVPFCQTGCPVNNLIPDWNDLVYRGRWKDAVRQLHATNNFPEFTGRICPAPCEASCVLGITSAGSDDQAERKEHRRARIPRRLDPSRAAEDSHRKESCHRRIRSGRSGRGATTLPRRTLGHGLRKGRPHRRIAPLRHSRIQAGEAHHRPPSRADVRRGREVRHQRGSRQEHCRSRISAANSTRSCWPEAPSIPAI